MGNTKTSRTYSAKTPTKTTTPVKTQNIFCPSPPLHVSIIQNAETPIKSGNLLKRGFRNPNSWKKRFCILSHDGYLNYYNCRNKLKGRANFHKATEVIQPSSEPLKFFIKTIKRTWEFKGSDIKNVQHWIEVIRDVSDHVTCKSTVKVSPIITETKNLKTQNSPKTPVQEKIRKFQKLIKPLPNQKPLLSVAKKVSFSVSSKTKKMPMRPLPKLRNTRSYTLTTDTLEFDSDDEDLYEERQRSNSQQRPRSGHPLKRHYRLRTPSYRDRRSRRRSIASSNTISTISHTSNSSIGSTRSYRLYDPTVTYDAWKISVTEALYNVTQEVQKRKTHALSLESDGYAEIAAILEDDFKLNGIFMRLTDGNPLMTYSQFMVSMSMLQRGRFNAVKLRAMASSLLNISSESPAGSPLADTDSSIFKGYYISPSVTPTSHTHMHESNDTFVMNPNVLSSSEFLLVTPKDSYNESFFPRRILHQRQTTVESDAESQISALSGTYRPSSTSVSFQKNNKMITMSTTNGRQRHSFLSCSQSSFYSLNSSCPQSLVIRDSLLESSIAEEHENDFPNDHFRRLIFSDSHSESSDIPELNLTALSLVQHSSIFLPSDDEKSIDEDMKYDDMHKMYGSTKDQMIEKQSEIRVEIPVNAASEIVGNFIAAQCGLCVPSMDIISSEDSARAYHVLQQYMNSTDQESGIAPTLIAYEELDGVSLGDLRTQLNQVQIIIKYKKKDEEVFKQPAGRTTQEQVQRFFVSVVKKTFGCNLPHEFSRDGRAILRDCGFIFALDMFLFNIARFPVSLPFEGIGNPQNLWISMDSDGDSALYGLQNRFMGGFDIIEMPLYLVPGRDVNTEDSLEYALKRQKEYCEQYVVVLQKFLSALSDYYTNEIKKNVNKSSVKTNVNVVIDDKRNLLHAKPRSPKGSWDDSRMKNKKHSSTIDGDAVLQKCLRPLAQHIYIHCGFELLIIDEFNMKKLVAEMSEEESLAELNVYRDALMDHMITLICEGILIGITEISDQLEPKDIDTILHDIKLEDANISGIQLINVELLKLVLRLFHSNCMEFELDIEDSSSGDEQFDINNSAYQYENDSEYNNYDREFDEEEK